MSCQYGRAARRSWRPVIRACVGRTVVWGRVTNSVHVHRHVAADDASDRRAYRPAWRVGDHAQTGLRPVVRSDVRSVSVRSACNLSCGAVMAIRYARVTDHGSSGPASRTHASKTRAHSSALMGAEAPSQRPYSASSAPPELPRRHPPARRWGHPVRVHRQRRLQARLAEQGFYAQTLEIFEIPLHRWLGPNTVLFRPELQPTPITAPGRSVEGRGRPPSLAAPLTGTSHPTGQRSLGKFPEFRPPVSGKAYAPAAIGCKSALLERGPCMRGRAPYGHLSSECRPCSAKITLTFSESQRCTPIQGCTRPIPGTLPGTPGTNSKWLKLEPGTIFVVGGEASCG
jgi:hypothetical protein